MTDTYKKLTQREHILQLPDTYIGSRDSHTEKRWIWSTDAMEWRTVEFNPGFFKIFDELVVNALDHVTRQKDKAEKRDRVSELRFTVTPTGFSVWNDGEGIPVVKSEYDVMVPELIFGHLLTSSNYDEGEDKIVGGKNGFGAKLTNIHSTEFVVRTCDGRNTYEQTFRDNMAIVGAPVITPVKKGSKAAAAPFTEIRSTPDLARFFGPAVTAIPDDMLAVLRTRVVDAAALARGCRVLLNGEPVTAASTFQRYVKLFVKPEVPILYERAGDRWEIAAVLTRNLHADACPEDRHITFVNGIFTRKGGKHLDAVASEVLGKFCAGPGAKLGLKPAQLKDAVTWFVNATIVNPSFDSQSKETLTTPAKKFGSTFSVSDEFVARLAKEGGLLDEATHVLDARLSREAKKTDGKRVARILGIPKLEDAAWAGVAGKSAECTLILTEGDSAATMAIAGLTVVGRERYGVFPLKGKSLNVRELAQDKKNANKELSNIKLALGLRSGHHYTSLDELRYGRLMIMADQDVDGSHIKGLLINIFHSEWPELLRLGFVCCLMTPLIKATKGKRTESFFSASAYDEWVAGLGDAGTRGWTIKYYKGLGTSTSLEARDYFTSMNVVRFAWDGAADESIDMAFSKKRANDRKAWLETYSPTRVITVPPGGTEVSFTRFIHDELIHFSQADNIRSIPHVMDGLKPCQRKILWASRKRGLTTPIKVAQLAGYVSEHAAYHHGEVALAQTIVGMAHNFVGSNNINLLAPVGQFGTRLKGGKDSAQPRYIFTALESIQSAVFDKADDPGLEWTTDDGQTVEPTYYLPVIPMLLVNGALGIGTGYSTAIPSFSPRDLVSAIRGRLGGSGPGTGGWPELVPWWDGFRGTIAVNAKKKNGFTTRGCYVFSTAEDDPRVHITELPVGTWTQSYKEFLDALLVAAEEAARKEKRNKAAAADDASVATTVDLSTARLIKGYKNDSSDTAVDIWITLDAEYFHEARAFPEEFEKRFKLVSSFSMTNMVAFDCESKIRLYESVDAILDEFYARRLTGYSARKANELARMDAEIVELDARVRFVRAVVDGKLVVANASDEVLLSGLRGLGVPPLSGSGEVEDIRAYEYLLRMRVDRLKASAVAELEAEAAGVREEREALAARTPEALWRADLDAFIARYEVFLGERAEAMALAEPVKAVGSKVPKGPKAPKAPKVKAPKV